MAKHSAGPIAKTAAYADYHFDQVQFSLEVHSTGITGTPDPYWNPRTAFTYLGAFKIPYQDMGSGTYLSTRDTESFGYDPVTNTMFWGKIENNVPMLSQFSIPTLSTSMDIDALPAATRLQDFTNISGSVGATTGFDIDNMGFIQVIGNKIFCGAYDDYNLSTNPYNVLEINGIDDLSTATFRGYINLKVGANDLGDLGATINFEIPSEHQIDFGGHTHGIACGNHVSVSSRWDYGHSFNAWTPTDIGASDTVYSSVSQYMYHTQTNNIGGFNDNNTDLRDYYHSWFCDPSLPVNAANGIDSYMYLPESEKLTFEQVQKLPRPAQSVYTNVGGWEVGARSAFIPKNSDTIVYVGEIVGAEIGRDYKGQFLEYTGSKTTTAGPEPLSKKDYKNCIWCVNLEDIKNAANLYDPQYYYVGNFAEEWLSYSNDRMRGRVVGAFFDSTNSILYVIHAGIYYPQNLTQTQHVISAYSVAAGSRP